MAIRCGFANIRVLYVLTGLLGQYILIVPDKDMVVVITECTLIDGRRQRRLVWNRLLPEVGDRY